MFPALPLRPGGGKEETSAALFPHIAKISRDICTLHHELSSGLQPEERRENLNCYEITIIGLFHRVSDAKPAMDETDVRSIYSQMLSAVSHIHAFSVVHRDIKLENWLICRGFIIKLIDFGLAHVYDRAAVFRPLLTKLSQCDSERFYVCKNHVQFLVFFRDRSS